MSPGSKKIHPMLEFGLWTPGGVQIPSLMGKEPLSQAGCSQETPNCPGTVVHSEVRLSPGCAGPCLQLFSCQYPVVVLVSWVRLDWQLVGRGQACGKTPPACDTPHPVMQVDLAPNPKRGKPEAESSWR